MTLSWPHSSEGGGQGNQPKKQQKIRKSTSSHESTTLRDSSEGGSPSVNNALGRPGNLPISLPCGVSIPAPILSPHPDVWSPSTKSRYTPKRLLVETTEKLRCNKKLITLECAVINTSRRMTCWTTRPILTKRTIVHRKILCISTGQVF